MMSFRITLALICGCFVAATEVDGQVTAPKTHRGHHRRPVVTAESVTPASGNGISQTFILRYSDSAGFDDLATTWVWFKTPLRPRANSCLAYYDRAAFTVSLLDDIGLVQRNVCVDRGELLSGVLRSRDTAPLVARRRRHRLAVGHGHQRRHA